jgi:crotonobetainyl-CoA:carnitine CoA-transferase CaiB-like acyl-CoA transferase
MTDAPPQDEVFMAADREFFIRISDDKQWIDFCRAVRDKLDELLSHIFAALPAEEWLRLCDEAGVSAGLTT